MASRFARSGHQNNGVAIVLQWFIGARVRAVRSNDWLDGVFSQPILRLPFSIQPDRVELVFASCRLDTQES